MCLHALGYLSAQPTISKSGGEGGWEHPQLPFFCITVLETQTSQALSTEVSEGIGLASADLGLTVIHAGSEEDKISRLKAAETLGQYVLGTGVFLLLCDIQSYLFTADI